MKKIVLTAALATLAFTILVAPVAFAEPDNKIPFTISGYAIVAPISETRVVGDGTILIVRSSQDSVMSLKYTLGSTLYYVKAFVSSDLQFNTKTMHGNGISKWTMEFHAKKLSIIDDNPVIGTLQGTTVAKFTAHTAEGITTGTGLQIGSHGTGIMEGVETKSEGTYYPLALTGPLGTIVTQGLSYAGTAIVNG